MSRRRFEDDDYGEPGPRTRNATPLVLILLIGLGLLGLVVVAGGVAAFLMVGRAGRAQDQARLEAVQASAATQAPAATTYKSITLAQLENEWKQNPPAANVRYKNVGVEFSGYLHEISSNEANQKFIEVGAEPLQQLDRGAHIFVSSAKARQELRKVKIGDFVIIRAKSTATVQNRPWLELDEIKPAN